ncbi:MAG: nucleotidyl transferase AbiEii/AbiGii toxin family protein [Luteolibacter sp.]
MLPDFAHSLHERFAREGISLLLAGGWAVCHHGYSRFTNDVDWICSRADETRAIELMKSLGFAIAFEAMATRFQRANPLEMMPIDLLWVSPETFSRMSATDQRTGVHSDIPVIDLESLLAMKLHALKDRVVRKERDLLDIRFLLEQNANIFTETQRRELCQKYAGPDAYDLIHNIP